jgi:hypothetical protein
MSSLFVAPSTRSYLEGETLPDRLTKGALPLDDALKIAIQTVDALSTAHRAIASLALFCGTA